MIHRCVPLLAAAALLAGLDDPPPHGVEIIPLVKQAVELVSPRESPVPGRPWSDDLAALTNPNPAVSGPAIGNLVHRGEVVLPDLAVLAADRDWQVRSRVGRVAAGIGGTAGAPLLLRLAQDPDARVRRLAIVGLRYARGDTVLARLAELLAANDPDERAAAAESLAKLGDPRGIPPLTGLRSDTDGPARTAKGRALRGLVGLPASCATVSGLLGTATGAKRQALLEALDSAADTRLCPALIPLLADDDPLTALLAGRALITCGDWRAAEALVGVATSERRDALRDTAAEALRVITGYRAGAGPAWSLWWKDNAARAAHLAGRDASIAVLMDPEAPLPDLAAYPTDELSGLVDASVGTGRPVTPACAARALAVLKAQGGRWVQPITDRIDATDDPELRLDLLVVLDEVGGHAAHDAFVHLREELRKREDADLTKWKDKGVVPPDVAAEHTLIELGLSR